jgi:hypothetical protein
MVRLSIALFGDSPTALRVPAFVAGVALIPLTALLCWSLFGSRLAAILSALAVCGSSQLVEYSVNARGYSWFALLTLVQVLCTIRIIETPNRRRLWVLWAMIGALGAYVLPLMLYPVVGLAIALFAAGMMVLPGSAKRRSILIGLAVALPACGAATILLYTPILMTQGLTATLEKRHITSNIWSASIPAFWSMAAETWSAWARDASVLWRVAFPLGLTVYLVRSLRGGPGLRFIPVIVALATVLIVGMQGIALHTRACLFLLPLALACASGGWVELLPVMPSSLTSRTRRWSVPTVGLIALTTNAVNIAQVRHLSSEPNTIIDGEHIVRKCQELGTERCALRMRYTPAIEYYRRRIGAAPFSVPGDQRTEQVIIVVDAARSVEQQWHRGVDGYALYEPPKRWQTLDETVLYVAARRAREASAFVNARDSAIRSPPD